MESMCSAEDCDRPATARGLCRKHYHREWKAGRINRERTATCTGAACGREFEVDRYGVIPSQCQECRKEVELKRVYAWSAANPEKVHAAKRRYKESNPRVWDAAARRVAWIRNLKKRYNLSLDDYERMVATQNGVCAICKGPARGRGADEDRFHVDHCHETDTVRGLLCSPCNIMLGLADDDPATLMAAVEYLNTHKALTVERAS